LPHQSGVRDEENDIGKNHKSFSFYGLKQHAKKERNREKEKRVSSVRGGKQTMSM
jgi:hypothetical protein